ncbi:carbohydrate-binding domain-containing protein [Candidatus Saccharibacteria bacterium]|nr:carbohydrate-binding domain-containing protein [Candidatus Saccharibacteria bacterium]
MVNEKYTKIRQIIFAVGVGVLVVIILVVAFLVGIDKSNGEQDGSSNVISVSGTHELTGSYQCIKVNTLHDVRLILNNAIITCESGPAIYIEESGDVEIVLKGENYISATTTEEFEGAIHSKEDLVLSGEGSLTINSNYDGIVGRDSVVIEGGNYQIIAEYDGIKAKDDLTINGGTFKIQNRDDGIRAKGKVEINGGTFDLDSYEGIEATYILINDGKISIKATDDGMNAGDKSDAYDIMIEINGGELTIDMGAGDTDAIDSNGDLKITGGTIIIVAQSPFDYDGKLTFTGGTVIVNGVEVDEITNQFMGGGGMNGGMPGEMNPGEMGPGGAGMPRGM